MKFIKYADVDYKFFGITSMVIMFTAAIIDVIKYQKIYTPTPDLNKHLTLVVAVNCIMSILYFISMKIIDKMEQKDIRATAAIKVKMI